MPTYERVDGLSLPWGPTISIAKERFVIDPRITYRSNLGDWDPGLTAAWHIDSAYSLQATGLRGTFTNDKWIRSDLLNSFRSLVFGADSRNYYRADRAEGRLRAKYGKEDQSFSLFSGAVFENSWSTGWRVQEGARGPYSIFSQNNTVGGMSRPNPTIDRGHIGSAIFGGGGKYANKRLVLVNETMLEASWKSPTPHNFTQLTVDQRGLLQTFGSQRIEFNAHLVYSAGDSTPRQRYAYIGGSRTLPTLDLLSRGGDRLFWFDVNYILPLKGVNLPLVGVPTIAPRFAAGAANVKHFGVPTSQIGGRLSLWLLQIDYMADPKTGRQSFDAGLSFPL